MIEKLSLDIGNSSVKGALMENDNTLINPIFFPSAMKEVSDAKYLTFPNNDVFYLRITESNLAHPNAIVAAGSRAMAMPNYAEYDVNTSSYKTGDPMTSVMLFASLLKDVHESGEITVKCALSIPVIEGRQLGLAKEYKEKLLGAHKIDIFRQNETLHVTVKIEKAMILNEGQAAFLGLLDTVDTPFRIAMNTVYDSLGEDEDPAPDLSDFIVVDIGEGTTDISVFRDKHFSPDFSFSITRGIGNVLEDAMANALREHLTIESRKELQKVLESSAKRQAKRRQKWENYVNPVQAAFVDKIVETIVKAYGMRDYYDAIIFAGGGFSALTGYSADNGEVTMRDDLLFRQTEEKLSSLNKDYGLLFGVPKPFSQTINQRGLMQVAATL